MACSRNTDQGKVGITNNIHFAQDQCALEHRHDTTVSFGSDPVFVQNPSAVLMQNLLVFCQHCFAWVEPHALMCPECAAEINLDQPELERDVLTESLGTPLSVIGSVRIDRRGLPGYGELIGTSSGILFLPRLHKRLNGAWEGVASTKLPGWWPFRGDHTTPRFLEWLRHSSSPRIGKEPTEDLTSAQKQFSLADRLMDSPGGFFAEHRFIQKITSRRRTVKLNRSPFRSITLIDESEDGSLHILLDSLPQQVPRKIDR
jgi:hypothetical protein